MKKLLLTLAAITLFISCSSPENKAEKLISQYLKENLKDPDSYSSISYEELDSTFTDGYSSPEYQAIDKKRKMYQDSVIFYSTLEDLDARIENTNKYSKLVNEAFTEMQHIGNNYKGEFKGWEMKHSYRAANEFGALDIYKQVFYFDKDITEIKNVITKE